MTKSTPSLRTDSDGTRCWSLSGKRHRTDGPAIEWADGIKAWWINGEVHRTDGPAFTTADGSQLWCFNGKDISVPYSHVLTAAFARGLPVPPEVLPDIFKAIAEEEEGGSTIDRLDNILNKYWPTHVQKILVTLLQDSDSALKHLAFSLLGRYVPPACIGRTSSSSVVK